MNNLKLMFYLSLFIFVSCNSVDVEYNTTDKYIKVPHEYVIYNVRICCDTSSVGYEMYNIDLIDSKCARSFLKVRNEYLGYKRRYIDTCSANSGVIFISIGSLKDSTFKDVYWQIFEVDKNNPRIKLHPFRI